MAVGESVATESDLRYNAVVLEFEGLEAFSGLTPISSHGDNESQTVVYRQLEPFKVELDETYGLSIEHHPAWAVTFGKHSLEHRASVRIRAQSETPVANFFAGPLAAFQRLVELAIGHRVRLRSVRAESSRSMREFGGRATQDHALLFFRQKITDNVVANLYPSDLLFNISGLGDQASHAIQNWHRSYSKLWPVIAFYFMLDPRFDLVTGLELHFINALSAIEHLHRLTIGRQRGKSHSLEAQLSGLIDEVPQRPDFLFEPRAEFISAVVATRSHLLHGQLAGEKTLTGKTLWMALTRLRLIIQAGLFKHMDLNEQQVAGILRRTREFRRLELDKRVSVHRMQHRRGMLSTEACVSVATQQSRGHSLRKVTAGRFIKDLGYFGGRFQMIRRLRSVQAVLTLRGSIALLTFCSVFSNVPIASACDPVVYLFRHAEEKPGGVTTNTLLLVGQQHADLYPSMIEGFQGSNCPVSWVYAMSSYNANGNIGTSNPYYTGYPSANVLPQKTPQNTIGHRKLFEFLPNEEQAFLTDIKSKLTDSQGESHSVAIFWSSQGMCKVAATLGSNLPNYNCESTKPPRNSFYVFAYDINHQTFTRTGNYLQCFNFNPFVSGSLEDKFSFDHFMGFPAGFVPAQYYCPASGNLAENDDPAYKSVFGTTGDKATKTPAANGSITALELSTLLRGQVCDVDNPQDNCHF